MCLLLGICFTSGQSCCYSIDVLAASVERPSDFKIAPQEPAICVNAVNTIASVGQCLLPGCPYRKLMTLLAYASFADVLITSTSFELTSLYVQKVIHYL